MGASNSKSIAVNFGLALLVVGLLITVFSALPGAIDKTLNDVILMLLGVSIQLLGLGLVIIGKK